MKALLKISLSILYILFSLNTYAQKNAFFRLSAQIPKGTYLFNTLNNDFFDGGINCYLLKQCRNIDSTFEATASKITFSKDTVVKYKAYLFTKNYEYLYVQIDKTEGWLRATVPISIEQKNFLKKFVTSMNYPDYASYVEIIPFKDKNKVFISDADDWYIADLMQFKIVKIGTKGGRLEACQMNFRKNCVLCFIDLGWGEYLWFDEDGKKCK